MVDEREAAAGPALAVAAAEQAPDAADGPDASIDSEDGSDKNPGTSSPPASRTAAPSNTHTGWLPLGVRPHSSCSEHSLGLEHDCAYLTWLPCPSCLRRLYGECGRPWMRQTLCPCQPATALAEPPRAALVQPLWIRQPQGELSCKGGSPGGCLRRPRAPIPPR